MFENLKQFDLKIYNSMKMELVRQQRNIVSVPVMKTMGSHLTNKDAEGYSGKRYYGGCEHIDEAYITTNKNAIPFESNGANITSGIRIGTPAVTTRGMKE